jgi:hypothetical protein
MGAPIADRIAAVQQELPFTNQSESVDGKSLVYWLRGKSKVERAITAAFLAEERLPLLPTNGQLADICKVNASYVAKGLALSPEEREDAWQSGVLPPARADVVRTIKRCGPEAAWNVIAGLI